MATVDTRIAAATVNRSARKTSGSGEGYAAAQTATRAPEWRRAPAAQVKQVRQVKYTEVMGRTPDQPPPLPPKSRQLAAPAKPTKVVPIAPTQVGSSGGIPSLAKCLRDSAPLESMKVRGDLHPARQRGRRADALTVTREGSDILLQRASELGSTRGVTITPGGVLWNGDPLPTAGYQDDASPTHKRVLERMQQALNGLLESKNAPLLIARTEPSGRVSPLAALRSTWEHVRATLPEGFNQIVGIDGQRFRVTVGMHFALRIEAVDRPGMSLVVSPNGAMSFTMPPIDHHSSAATIQKAADWMAVAQQAAKTSPRPTPASTSNA